MGISAESGNGELSSNSRLACSLSLKCPCERHKPITSPPNRWLNKSRLDSLTLGSNQFKKTEFQTVEKATENHLTLFSKNT